MKEGPDIARIASLIGDPARANMLSALMTGHALTAGELAREAGVTVQTASTHLARLRDGGLIEERKQGRHKYLSLAGPEVAAALEALTGLAAGAGHLRTRPGPREGDLRRARVCYDHLAGEMGIRLYDSLLARDFLMIGRDGLGLTESGARFVTGFGVDLTALRKGRSVLCRECLDWSERRSHLAGSLGRAFLSRMVERKWAVRVPESRVVRFTKSGERQFDEAFPETAPAK